MSKILITGGAGFIGSHLTDKLIEEGNEVVVVDNLSTGKKENLNVKAKFYEVDICDSKISQIFQEEKPEIVFHFAAQIDVRKSIDNPMSDAEINILGSLNLLENCRKVDIKKFIFISSGGAVYGDTDVIPTPESQPENPESPYGITKMTIEKYLCFYKKTFGLNYTILRPANVYGPRQDSRGEGGVVAIFCDKILKNEEIRIDGNGEQTRDFIYVKDVVNAGVMSMEQEKNEVYNIGTGIETNVNEILEKIRELTSSNCKGIHDLAKSGGQTRSCLDFSKARQELGWQPEYDLEKGLKETIEWFKKNEY